MKGEEIIALLRQSIDKTAENVVQLLREKGLKIATAESCTGGLVSGALTSVSGSSEVFSLGICTYSNEQKMKQLSVPADVLESYGAVSHQTARCMAKGVRLAADSDIGVSTTGTAGPSGGTEQNPVGTVYIGISTSAGHDCVPIFADPKECPEAPREYVRLTAVLSVLELILELINAK